ncbi:maleylacetoacetate isomerase [Aliiroseovarius crassostreae]|uniref:maleylacetoacetate isomerase n=1 Tax=Aliiroseovarius crassostreae TaxID=154981 RepID=UPI0021AEFA58|nr:maleylacetoacetate isomerase [Aliiroseovarius crassostreae]UWP89116.1 maleylacetoacetate isomerase [Aliiroseovarius crassostreae]
MGLKLYTYWRSTTSYRVRIALNLKGVPYESHPVNLVKGEQRSAEFQMMNPGKGVPVLELEDGTVLTQSLAILDYLDHAYPDPALLPNDPLERARVMAAAHIIALDIHPVNNLRVVQHLDKMGHSKADSVDWMVHWMTEGLTAFQATLPTGTKFAFGDRPTLADICLVSQLYNGHRWGVDMAPFARLTEIEETCLALPTFAKARPEAQPDAE